MRSDNTTDEKNFFEQAYDTVVGGISSLLFAPAKAAVKGYDNVDGNISQTDSSVSKNKQSSTVSSQQPNANSAEQTKLTAVNNRRSGYGAT